ncbi:hypothetical protein [Aeromicrobium sp. P5_D10]
MLERRSALLIVGSPGSNRHRLGTEIVASIDGHGAVLRHVCKFGEADRPHQLLARVFADLGGTGDTPVSDQVEAIRRLVRAEHPTAPTLLLEDATFASPASLAALAELAASRDLQIIAAMTPETVELVPELAAATERIDLEPLGAETITQLLQVRFRGTPHDILVEFLHESSHGRYASLCEIADMLAESGAIVAVEGIIVFKPSRLEEARLLLPERRRSNSAERLGGSTRIVDLIDLVSIIVEVEIDEAIACTSAEDVALTVRHGPIRQVDGVLSMVDPLEAESVVAALTPQRSTELWQTYAPRIQRSVLRPNSAIRAARWFLDSGSATSPELARIAARESNERGLYQRTVAYTSPRHTRATPLDTQHERSHALIQLGDVDGLRELFGQLDPATIPLRELMAFMRWATSMVPPTELPSLRHRALGPDRDTEERHQRAAVITLAELGLLAFRESSDQHIRRVRTLVFSGALPPIDHAMAHTLLAALLRHSGRPAEAVHAGRISVALLEAPESGASAPELDAARETLFMSLVAALDLDGAEDVLRRYQSRAARYGRPGRLGPLMSGILEFYRGRIQHGLASLELLRDDPVSQDVLHSRGWVEALAAQALIGLGRSDEAEALLEASEAHPVSGLLQSDLERRIAQAFVHDSLADPDRALEILEEVAEQAHLHGLKLVEFDALALAVLIDGPTRTPRLLEAVGDLVAPSGMPAIWQTFATHAAQFDFPGLVRLVEENAAAGQVILAGRLAQYTLDSGRRATDLTPAEREWLNQVAQFPPSQF